MKMKELANFDRPYEKLEQFGATALSDSELLAILLKTGTKKKPVLQLAQEIMALDYQQEGLSFLTSFSLMELQEMEGIGRVKAIQLKALCELVSRNCYRKPLLKEKIKTPEQLSQVVMSELKDQKQEYIKTILLDNQNRVIKTVTNAIGGLNANCIEVREILKEPIKQSAAKIALAHNHPSGDVTPSQSDVQFTLRVRDACHLVGVELMDHVIIGKGDFASLKRMELF